jgi:hypothetical protein
MAGAKAAIGKEANPTRNTSLKWGVVATLLIAIVLGGGYYGYILYRASQEAIGREKEALEAETKSKVQREQKLADIRARMATQQQQLRELAKASVTQDAANIAIVLETVIKYYGLSFGSDLGGDIGKNMLQQYIAKGGAPNMVIKGYPLLFYAATNGYKDIVEELISKGADVNAEAYGTSPLRQACGAGDIAIAKLLIAKGASIRSKEDYRGTLCEKIV